MGVSQIRPPYDLKPAHNFYLYERKKTYVVQILSLHMRKRLAIKFLRGGQFCAQLPIYIAYQYGITISLARKLCGPLTVGSTNFLFDVLF